MDIKQELQNYIAGDDSIDVQSTLRQAIRPNLDEIRAGIISVLVNEKGDSDYLTSAMGAAAWTALTDETVDGRAFLLFRLFCGENQSRIMSQAFRRMRGDQDWYTTMSPLVSKNFSNKTEFVDWMKELLKSHPTVGFKLMKLFK